MQLPNDISLTDPDQNAHYHKAAVRIPGLRPPYTAPTVRISGTRVIWGLTVLKTAQHPEYALKFLQLLFSSQGVTLQTATGPAPISPPLVSRADYTHLPESLRSLVSVQRGERAAE